MKRFIAALSALTLLAVAAPAALAGIGFKDVPLLDGNTKGKVLYTVSGVVNDSNNMGSAISCTSTEKEGGKDVVVGVEFFTRNGTLVNDLTTGDGVVVVPPGYTRAVVTQPTEMLNAPAVVTFGYMGPGSARIIASSARVVCTAWVLDPDSTVPASWVMLPMFRKGKQRGQ
jgi:hypothetical protein